MESIPIERTQSNSIEGRVPTSVFGLFVEQFYPAGQRMISVRPRNITGIMVSGADCDVGQPECFASFVIDNFLRTVPTHRIVVLNGRVAVQGVDEVTKTDLDAFFVGI